MKLSVHLLESRVVDVCVDLRGGDAGVAQHLLHLPQVGAASQKMRGETVTQGVRTDFARHAHARRVFLDQFPNPLAAQRRAAR